MQLDQHFVNTVRATVRETWQQIGHDVIDQCEDNEQAMEMCLDADRLLLNGGDPVSHAAVKMAVRANGYVPTLKFLAKHIQVL
jgi:hypothetical protein